MKAGYKIYLAAGICVFLASVSQAVAVVSYNFDNTSTVGGDGAGSYPGATHTAGVVEVGYWHNSWPAYPGTDLTNSLGRATTIDIATDSNSGTWSLGAHPGPDSVGTWNKEMLNGYLNGTGANSSSVTFSQIPYNGYDIYVYFAADDPARFGTVSDGTTTYSFNILSGMVAGNEALLVQTSDTDLNYPAANYCVFSNLTGSSKTVATSFMLAGQYGGISAIQIVENTNALFGISGIPEGESASGSALLEATVTEGIATFYSASLYLDHGAAPVATTSSRNGITNAVSYSATGLSSGTHTCRVDVVSVASAPAVVQSYAWTFEALPFGTVTTYPALATANRNPTLQAVVVEGASMVDAASTLYLDGVRTSATMDRSMAPTTTISFAASDLSIGTHTGKVVVVGSPDGGPLTNEWTFTISPAVAPVPAVISWSYDQNGTVGSPDGVTYSDAPAGVVAAPNWNNSWWANPTNNLRDNAGYVTTLDIHYQSFNTYSIQGGNPGADSDGTFNKEMLNGYLNAGPAAWHPATSNTAVTVAEIPYSTYDIYVYISSDVAGRAFFVTDGSTTNYGTTLGPDSIATGTATFAQASENTVAGYSVPANYVVFSGLTGTAQSVSCQFVFLDEWGGIAGIQVVNRGLDVNPNIQSLAVMGGSATLTWASERGATYSIQSKTTLAELNWTTKQSGIVSEGDESTTETVTASSGSEFYRIKGE